MGSRAPRTDVDTLSELGDVLLRAQRVTGVAPNVPAVTVYREDYEPRLVEARRRLRELGYPRGLADYELFARFREEAGLPPTSPPGRFDRAAWEALDELRGLEGEVDEMRWRDREGRLLPAMRRAIRARSGELELASGEPLVFSGSGEETGEEPPEVGETAADLRGLAGALGGGEGELSEEELLRLLFDQERMLRRAEEAAAEAAEDPLAFGEIEDERVVLYERVRRAELARLGVVGDAALDDEDDDEDDEEGYFDEVDLAARADDEPLAFGEGRPRLRIREFFRDLVDKPEFRERPNDRQLRMHLIKITPLLDTITGIEERWREFRDDSRTVWEGKRRASAWLHGASKWLKERGLGLAEGLERLLKGAARAIKRLAGYVKAMFTNLFRVLYHDLARVFEATHAAAVELVEYVRGPRVCRDGELQVAMRRRADRIDFFVAESATADEIGSVRRRLKSGDQRLALSAELLGLVLGAVASWTLGSLSALAVLRDLGGRAQRILYVGGRLLALGRPSSS